MASIIITAKYNNGNQLNYGSLIDRQNHPTFKLFITLSHPANYTNGISAFTIDDICTNGSHYSISNFTQIDQLNYTVDVTLSGSGTSTFIIFDNSFITVVNGTSYYNQKSNEFKVISHNSSDFYPTFSTSDIALEGTSNNPIINFTISLSKKSFRIYSN